MNMEAKAKALLCPSSRCEPGARLLGVVQSDGTVAFTPDDLRVDDSFVSIARLGRKPESRFRFAGPCHREACAQWMGRCGVVDGVLEEIATRDIPTPAVLPQCSIRVTCRWFEQAREAACRACSLVVTELALPQPG